MGHRREAREYALQMFFQRDLSGASLPQVQQTYWSSHPDVDSNTREFADFLIAAFETDPETIDNLIREHAVNWKLERMPAVDKNILRMAATELRCCEDIPARVTLNESIEIAKRYGSEDSASFINGVLDKIAKKFGKE